jgi:NADH:ubiquinone oxidoreductase subunit 6 (subunit J)
MRQSISIHSKAGNIALAFLGLLYVVGTVAMLILFVVATWDGTSLVERALQLALAGSAFVAAFLVYIAAQNLGYVHGASTPFNASLRRSIRPHPAGAAISS